MPLASSVPELCMDSNLRQWSIAFVKDGKRGAPVPLSDGVSTLGRDPSNSIRLPDSSVSRFHADLRELPDGVQVRDVKSRNGIKVNGVPRKSAMLQPGDAVDVGIYRFELVAVAGAARARAVADPGQTAAAYEQTIPHRSPITGQGTERLLSMLSHVCFWVAEDLDKEQLLPRLLGLLRDGFNAVEAHLYTARAELQAFAAETMRDRPAVKLAPYLAEKCQALAEASLVSGEKVRRHQQRVGNYNYLVGPLRSADEPGAKTAFLLLIRPDDWADFTAQDKVVLQAICQLWVRAQGRVQQVQALKRENAVLKQKTGAGAALIGAGSVMQKLRERLAKVAGTKATVLIQGETGSGKEVVAQALHDLSPRSAGPFVKLNCAAMPEGLIESELFGHVKGAFTDAKSHHDGKFVQANGGTLFLDEIGEMPLTVQAKLLRAIETGEIEPVGGEKTKKVDVRIVAATHRDLAKMAADGQFRQDLLYRLNVVQVRVPPLREHPEDLPELAAHFLGQFCAENGLADLVFGKEALAGLALHPWPGNVRELRNVVQRCAIEAGGMRIEAEEVRGHLRG